MSTTGTIGNDTLQGTSGNDIYQGFAGNDALQDYAGGNDTYIYNKGDGFDTISDYNSAGTLEQDVLKFGAGITAANLVFTDVNGGDLQIGFNNSATDSITIQYHLYGDARWDFSTIQFNDGSTLDISYGSTAYTLHSNGTAGADTVFGGAGPNILNGLAGNDVVVGGNLNDTLDGGTGADSMYGGTGDDTYYVDNLDDYIYDAGGNDTVVIAAGLDNAKIDTSIEHVVYASPDTLKLAYFIDALTSGAKWGPTGAPEALTYSFVTSSALSGFTTYTEAEKTVVRQALADYASVSGLTFSEVGDSSAVNIRFFQDGGPAAEGASGYTTYPPNSEVHINPDYASNYHVFMHEIGHALGFKHPGNYNGSSTGSEQGPFLPAAEDNTDNTHMSYNGFGEGGDYMRAFDVASIQYLYGVNTSVRAGSDTYTQNDRFIWDGGGTDTLDVSSATAAATLDLRDGAWQWIGAKADSILATGQFYIGNGTQIEKAIGTAFNDTIRGNEVANILNGGAGNDTLSGGAGNDLYIVDSTLDVVIEGSNAGTDGVQASVSYSLSANVENLTLTGSAAINGIGNSLNNVITGNSAANTLNGGGGADTLSGGLGNDLYVVDSSTDVVVESLNAGIDTVRASVSYTLTSNVENLVLTGSDNINATGNALDNTLTGNSGNNTLNGGTGTDTLIGGAGNDLYIVANSADVITEGGNSGTDSVQSSVTYYLSANLENLTLTGSVAINGVGNTSNNTISGNSGDNVLNGAGGADSMAGGLGNDLYVVDNSADVVTELAAQGTDTVNASVSYGLSANVENLTLTGTAAINATGNALANTIRGNSGANLISGGDGNDILTGAGGIDHFIFNTALNATSNTDTITDFGSDDKLDLSHLIFSNLGAVGALTTSELVSGAGLTSGQDANDFLVYNTTTGNLYYDADGSGAGASILFAQLGTTTHPSLTAAVIQVV
jgi:Ca2+-binding RTX toxin-like protein